ncbi:hypothetical protein [Corynebacterium camporealensis]|uniref:Uncharacterized protein n=1 Tax=Corynebacterium camporealensis TaxID=161896 RepID=A0A0F6QVS6_9CORY|nr:hypothetical protein [Corynebacterium camporealensis]AKE38550.1 hypothetical protein UL81_02845 [Corynebacterium camporealensis]
METNPEKIIANMLDDMAEIGDWISIADATATNGKNSFHATHEDVMAILTAVKGGQTIIPGKIEGRFQDLPSDWDPSEITSEVFDSPDPIAAVMTVLFRPTGDWPELKDGNSTPA